MLRQGVKTIRRGWVEVKKRIKFGLLAAVLFLAGCEVFEDTDTEKDKQATMDVADKLAANQPTPTDINYSLERYNLIKRAYWVNGQREKALSLPTPMERPLGYITLFTDSGAVVGSFVVDGKVSSLNSYLTPDSLFYEAVGDYVDGTNAYENEWLADVDGSYGENDQGIFFFTPDAKYLEWTGTYLYSDIPFQSDDPILKVGVTP